MHNFFILILQKKIDIVCLLSHLRIFHSYGDVTITGEGLQMLSYARDSRPLSTEGSLSCHTNCDTGHPFIMVISEDPWYTLNSKPLAVELSLPYFNNLGVLRLGIEHPTFLLRTERSNRLRHRGPAVYYISKGKTKSKRMHYKMQVLQVSL